MNARILKLGLLFLLSFLVLAACAPSARKRIPVSAQNPPAAAQEYRIQAGDLLEIKYFYSPELNEQVTVRPDGRISLQLASELDVVGMTAVQLEEMLRKKYAEELENPEITVFVRSFAAQKVYVDGEVNRAGLIALTNPMTVLQAISLAGGFRDTAKRDEVIVVRRTADNQLTSYVVNMDDAIQGKDETQDIVLYPNDIVFVPIKGISSVNRWIDQYIRRNIPIPTPVGVGI